MATYIGGGWVKLRRALYEHTATGKLSGNDTYVLISLVTFADKATGVFDGCASIVAKWIGLPEDSVTKALARLEERGYILRDFVQGRKAYYRILIDKYSITMGAYKNYRVTLAVTKELTKIPEGALKQQVRKKLRNNIKLAITSPVYERDPEVADDLMDEKEIERVYQGKGELVGELVSEAVDNTTDSTGSRAPESREAREAREPQQTQHSNIASGSVPVGEACPAGQQQDSPAPKPVPISEAQTQASSAPAQALVSVPDHSERNAKSPAQPKLSSPELSDIRKWNEDRFGISGERLRNCIIYQLDYSRNDWYRTQAEITLGKMNSERFVRKLNDDTPVGWTPEKQERTLPSAQSSSNPYANMEYRKPQYSIVAALKRRGVINRGLE